MKAAPVIALFLSCVFAARAAANSVLVDRDVRYVENGHERQVLDVYSTLEGDDRPVIVWIHGGGWRIGDKSRTHAKVDAFVKQRGGIFVAVNYRYHPEADYKQQTADIAAAIDWTVRHAPDYGGSSDRVVVMGHSAGAHLAALVVCDPTYLQKHDRSPDQLRGVVLLDGAGYDIAKQIQSTRLQTRDLYRTVFGDDPAEHQQASPMSRVGQGKLPPFLVTHCAHRPDSSTRSKALVDRINQAGGHAELLAAAGKDHAAINRDLGVPDDEFSDKVVAWIEQAAEPRN